MPTEAREAILSRVRAALASGTAQLHENAQYEQISVQRTVDQAWREIPRTFRRGSAASRDEVLELLIDRLHDYDAQVLTAKQSQVTEAIHQMLTARGVRTILLPAGFPEEILPQGPAYVRDEALSAAQLNDCDGVITECTLAVAETGTLVLQSVAGQGRRAVTLVPDYHLCLVDSARVLATVPEAIAALHATAALPTTFVSGPSATADIEMTRIKGVHGPRFLDVILIVR